MSEVINLTQALPEWVKGSLIALNKPREYMVFNLRFGLEGGEPATLEAVGHTLGVARERIRQLESRGIATLRSKLSDVEPPADSIEREILDLEKLLQSDNSSAKSETELFEFLTTRYGTALTPTYERHYRLLLTVLNINPYTSA